MLFRPTRKKNFLVIILSQKVCFCLKFAHKKAYLGFFQFLKYSGAEILFNLDYSDLATDFTVYSKISQQIFTAKIINRYIIFKLPKFSINYTKLSLVIVHCPVQRYLQEVPKSSCGPSRNCTVYSNIACSSSTSRLKETKKVPM